MPIRRIVRIFFVLAVLSFVFVNCGVTHAQTPEYYLPSIKVEEPHILVAEELPPFPECLIMGRWGETLCQMLYIIALQIANPIQPPPPPPTPTPDPATTYIITALGDTYELGQCEFNPGPGQWCSLHIRFSEINITVCPEAVGASVDLIEGEADVEVDAEDIWLDDGVMWAEVFPPNPYDGQDPQDYQAIAYCKEQ